jgi:hypothetical protein
MWNNDITIAITSCGRYKLLQKTIQSLQQSIDITQYKKIITEDSRDKNHIQQMKKANESWFLRWRRIIYTWWSNKKNPWESHKSALEALYNAIDTTYVFHCEDDWYFTRMKFNYLELSKAILEKNHSIGIISLRNRFQKTENNIWLSSKKIKEIYFSNESYLYFWFHCIRLNPYTNTQEFYTLNPWLRRTTESKKIIIWHEKNVDEWKMWERYKSMWLFTVNLEPPIVEHIWWLRNSTRFFKDWFVWSLIRVLKNWYNHYIHVLFYK